jgi:hypothetical protein
MEFWITEKDNLSIKNPLKRIKYYSYFDSNRYKIFKYYPGVSLVPKKGHAPTFSAETIPKISKHKGISRHYKFRNFSQAFYKIGRVIPEPGKPDFGFHYTKFKKELEFFVIPSEKLSFYNEDKEWCMEKKFDGNRMNQKELIAYLKLSSETELNDWFKKRKDSVKIMGEKTLFFITRHASKDEKFKNIWTGQIDAPLSDKGKKESEELGEKLNSQNINFDVIISSKMKRCAETAKIVKSKLHNNPELLFFEELKEMTHGEIDGLTEEDKQKITLK